MRVMNRINRRRRGITAVLAMMYMTLFATLALGFYASVTTAVQVAKNEQKTARALNAAESGMAFMKYHLANLGVPAGTTQDQLFGAVLARLKLRLESYPVMTVDYLNPTTNLLTSTTALVGNPDSETITIPDRGKGIRLDSNGTTFNVVIKKLQNGEKLQVNVYGNAAGVSAARGTRLEYSVAQDAAKIFNFGVASKSAITMNGNVAIQGTSGNPGMGSVLSATTSTTTPLTMIGAPSISGDVSFTQSNPTLNVSTNATIAGQTVTSSSFSKHVHSGVGSIDFPVIKTDMFAPFVPAAGTTADGTTVISTLHPPLGSTFRNIRIQAGSTVNFNAATITGVVYIEADPLKPTNVNFAGNTNITGVVVVQTPDPAGHPNNDMPPGVTGTYINPSTNTISFAGTVDFKGVDQLPTNDAVNYPAALRALTGSMVLAPGFGVSFTGNFNSVNGSIFGSQVSFSGNAGGTVYGSVVNLRDTALSMGGTSDIVVQSQGTANYPAGVYFGSHYSPLPATYAELTQ